MKRDSSNATWDVIIAGTGAVGSAALYQSAKRGARVLGIDRFSPPHDRGSSHGDTRITRLALGEGAEYLQFARRSHEIWRELESVTGRTLLRQVGGLIFGVQGGCHATHGAADFLATTIDVARSQGISHEVLDATALASRFPQFRWRGDETGCLEHSAGFVHPEGCIAAQLEMAQRSGAGIHTGEGVLRWKISGGGVSVMTDKARYETGRLILTAGAWLPSLVDSLAPRARVYRQVLFWFEPSERHDLFTPERMPVFICVAHSGTGMFYGFPAIDGPGGGLKIAGEQFETNVTPDTMPTDVHDDEMRAMYALASPHLKVSARCVRAVACKYTVTPDFAFVIDQHPDSDRVWFASACSGHGFKHSAAVGEALAEIATLGTTRFDLSRFQLARF